MREDTSFGPVWIFPDMLPEKAAKHGARLDLMWPDLEGFVAMHMGNAKGGAWLVRAPKAALENSGCLTASASEWPVAEGTVWPPVIDVLVKVAYDSHISGRVIGQEHDELLKENVWVVLHKSGHESRLTEREVEHISGSEADGVLRDEHEAQAVETIHKAEGKALLEGESDEPGVSGLQ